MAFTNLVNNGASSLSTQAEKPVKPFTGVTAIGDTRLELRIYVNTQETGGGVMAAEGIQHYPGTNIDYYRGSAAEINDFLQRVEFIPSRGAPGKPTTTNFALFLIDVQKQDITGRIYYAVVDTAAPQSISGAKSDQTIHSDSSIHPFSGVTINDAVANATETLTIQLSDAGTGGVLSLSGAAGVGASLTDKGDGLYQLTTTHNSAAELTMALAQLTFTPSQTGAPHTQVKTTFTLSATSSASGDLAVTDATTAVTTIYETPPTITGAVAGLRANVASPINPFPAIVINDNPDAQLTVTITLTGGAGTLTLDPTAGGLALSGGGNGVYTLQGSADDVTRALRQLMFTPDGTKPGAITHFAISVQSNFYWNPVTETTTTVIDAEPVETAITGVDPQQQTIFERTVHPFANITVTDNYYGSSVFFAIYSGIEGPDVLSGLGQSDGYNNYHVSGSAAEITALLRAATYTPNKGASTVKFELAYSNYSDRPIYVTVAVTNSDPVIPTITPIDGSSLSNQATTSEGPIKPFQLVVDDSGDLELHSMKIELSGAGGELSAPDQVLKYSADGGYYWVSGTYAELQSVLDSMTFKPKAGAPATQSRTNFKITLYHGENLDTPLVTYDQVSVINIDPPVAPAISATSASLTATSDVGVKPFADVTITDANAGATEKLTITMTGGGGTLAGQGLTDNGDGTYTLTGSAAEVESLLQGLTFTPDGKNPGAVTTFKLTDKSIVNNVAVADSNTVTVSVTDTDPPLTTVSFATQTTFGTGAAPQLMTFGDFNRDGKQDIVVTNYNDKTVSILLGNGDGTFQQKVSYATGKGPVGISVEDFNHDGNLDLVVANTGDNTASILLGKGDGTFQSQVSYQTGTYSFSASVADVDDDGIPDLIVANYSGDNTISVLIGKGDGTFKPQVTYATGDHPNTAFAADFNKDGDRDIVVTNFFDDTVLVLLGNGDGSFRRDSAYTTGNGPTGGGAADFNRDGKLDLVIANYYDNSVSVLLGNGDGTFQQQKTYAAGRTPTAFSVADVNGDGNLDIVVQNYDDNTVSVLLGKGEGTFQPQKTLAVGSNPGSVVVSDFNGDGQPDIVVSNMSDGTISVLLNTTHAVPTISGVTAGQSANSKTPIKPFAGVTITDANAGATEKLTITMRGGGGTLAGEGLTDNGDGTYTLTGSAAEVESLLKNLTFKPDGKDPGDVTTFRLVDRSFVNGVEVARSAPVTVEVTELAPPVITSANSASVAENVATSAIVYTATAGHDDAGANLVWSISGGADQSKFAIDSKTGAVSFLASPDFESRADSDHNNVYDIVVRASEGQLYTDQAVAITVTNEIEPTSDFNGDHHSDILLQNVNNGAVQIWQMDGNGLTLKENGSGSIGDPGGYGDKWKVKGTGDFNGDGHSDLVWQYADSGAVYIWQMGDDGKAINAKGYSLFGADGPGAKWQVKGTGDFNGDGKSDLVFQYADTGAVYIWQMGDDGLSVNARGYGLFGADGPGAKWQVKGTGDFNGDGKSDIVFQYADTGAVYIWQMADDGLNVKARGYGLFGADGPGAKWQVKATGDFDDDGNSDILFQYADTGAVYIWEMADDGLSVKARGLVGEPEGYGPKWEVKGAGDFDGDGKSDILWQYADTGECYVWELDGLTIKARDFVGGSNGPGADWHATV